MKWAISWMTHHQNSGCVLTASFVAAWLDLNRLYETSKFTFFDQYLAWLSFVIDFSFQSMHRLSQREDDKAVEEAPEQEDQESSSASSRMSRASWRMFRSFLFDICFWTFLLGGFIDKLDAWLTLGVSNGDDEVKKGDLAWSVMFVIKKSCWLLI